MYIQTQCEIHHGMQKCWGFYLNGAVIENALEHLRANHRMFEPLFLQSKINNLKLK